MKGGIIMIIMMMMSIGMMVKGCTLGTVTGCSTNVAAGLTAQIVSELNSMGYSFRTMDSTWVKCPGWTCVLQTSAATALENAAKNKNDYITLNSAFRSAAQQYILYSWYLSNKCSITLAAVPGKSNHEGGRAIDTSHYTYWKSTLESFGFTHSYPSSDPVHFDYLAAPDIAKENLKAFQRLWNRNNPTSTQLVVDGIYGTNTGNALKNSPCNGW